MLHSWNVFKMQWLRISKYIIFLILLRFQNLWNLINELIKKKEFFNLNISYDFSKLDGLRKSKHDILSGSPKDIFAIFIVINASIEMF